MATETTSYSFDLRDLLLTKSDPTGHTLTYGYDATGNRTNFSVSSVISVLNQSYFYDNRNRVTNMTANGKSMTFTYDAASRLIAQALPNGTTVTNGFDNAHQLLSRVHKKTDTTTIASFLYGYDSSGNRTNMTTLEGVNAYSYNSNNWLTAATYPGSSSQQFFYDPVGNRTNLIEITGTVTNTTRSTIAAANRLASSFSSSSSSSAVLTNLYTYDAAGRLTNQVVGTQARGYSYSFRSQMTSLTDTNSTSFNYDFDGDGNRTSQAGSGCLTTKFVYDGPNVVLDLNASNQVVHAYVNGLGIDQPIERIAYLGNSIVARHTYHNATLGNIVAMTDSLQTTVKAYTYESFGTLRTEAGSTVVNRRTYTSRESLGDSIGLAFYRARVLDPSIGRFTSEDAFQFQDGVNTYVYVRNNPNILFDPYGLVSAGDPCTCSASGTPKLTATLSATASGYNITFSAGPISNVGGGCYTAPQPFWTTCWLGTATCNWQAGSTHSGTYNPYSAGGGAAGAFVIKTGFKIAYLYCDMATCKWKNKYDIVPAGDCHFIHTFNCPWFGDHWECSGF